MNHPDLPHEVVSPLREGQVSLSVDADRELPLGEVQSVMESRGSLPPLMKVIEVYSLPAHELPLDLDGNMITFITVGTTSDGPTLSDVRVLLGRIGDELEAFMHAGRIEIQPSVSEPQDAVMEDVLPKLLIKVERNRGTEREFRDGMETLASTWNPMEAVIETRKKSGTNVGYAIGRGTTLDKWGKLLDDAFASRGRAKTDLTFDAVAVIEDEYESWLSHLEAE